jgi:hypothetical protein
MPRTPTSSTKATTWLTPTTARPWLLTCLDINNNNIRCVWG